MAECTGWMLDVYADAHEGVVIWLLGADGVRHRLRQVFPIRFYVSGPGARLRALWKYLTSEHLGVSLHLSRVERQDLFQARPVTVMAIQVQSPARDRACEWENPAWRKRSPKRVEISQNRRCSVPIQATDWVDCENSQATGAKPTSRMLISISKPASSPHISARRACDPLRQVKM